MAVVSACGASAVEPEAIRAAVAKSLPLLENASRISMEKRKQCFTCHNVGLPVLALTVARQRGFAIDAENLRQQVEFTAAFLTKNRTNYLAGSGQGGQALTAGQALWTLANGGWQPDSTTAAVAEYLLLKHKDLDHWKVQTTRPPTEESLFAVSYFALRGLKSFGESQQRQRIGLRTEQVRTWALKTEALTTEDRVFRLHLLHASGATAADIRGAELELLGTQQKDGSWAQLPDMESDPYATATALVALRQAAGLSSSHAAYQNGLSYLLSSQLEDGSWHVKTRSIPIQTYYESGYPHGEDQFISITAAGWASTALALALPVPAESTSRLKVESNPSKLVVRSQLPGAHDWIELATYVMETNSRPYLHPIRDATGRVVLTEDRPADHPWQHGIFTGFHRVNGFNYWKEDEGKQRFVRLLELKEAPDRISWRALVELVAPNGDVVLEEEDAITVHAPESSDAYIIDFEFLLRAREQDVNFGKFFVGGLAVRMPWDKANPRQTHLNSNGLRDRACEQQRAAWCNVERPLGNDTFGMTVFDHPANPGYPSGWRADEQGLINPNVSALGDWKLPAKQMQRFRYRLLVYRGFETAEELTVRFETFVGEPLVPPP